MSEVQEQLSVDAIAGIRRQEYERGIAEGRRLERSAVVADLRARSQRRSITGFEGAVLLAEAGRYERGEHTKEGT